MKPAEIGRLWAEHYPNRHSDHVSGQMCTLICSLLRELARREIGCASPTMRLNKILDSARIPIEQLEECEEEVNSATALSANLSAARVRGEAHR